VNEQDIHAVLDRLVPRFDDQIGDWDAVLAASTISIKRLDRPTDSHPRLAHSKRRLVLLAAALGAALLVAVTIASPWRGGPTILERAAAAMTGPGSNQVLYESVTVHARASSGTRAVTHLQLWLTGTRLRRFRVLIHGTPSTSPIDVGGTLGNTSGLSYSAAQNVIDPVTFPSPLTQADLDPAGFIRAAIASGHARVDGTTTIAGRKVIRILVTSRLFGRVVATTFYFVDAHTYQPVRVTVSAAVPNASPPGFPLASITALPYGRFSGLGPPRSAHYTYVYDFAEFRYLASTPGNLKLGNVQAQHPNAKVV
jgi:hypothetical protein